MKCISSVSNSQSNKSHPSYLYLSTFITIVYFEVVTAIVLTSIDLHQCKYLWSGKQRICERVPDDEITSCSTEFDDLNANAYICRCAIPTTSRVCVLFVVQLWLGWGISEKWRPANSIESVASLLTFTSWTLLFFDMYLGIRNGQLAINFSQWQIAYVIEYQNARLRYAVCFLVVREVFFIIEFSVVLLLQWRESME